MKILASAGKEDIAIVYVAELRDGKLVELVESVQPPLSREKKWVLIVSTLFGCPVKCLICDAGSLYQGKLSKEDIFSQIDFLVKKRFPDGNIPVEKFKIQFARMGEPAFNPNVLQVLEELPSRYNAPGLIPTISTIAPTGTDGFFQKLLILKNKLYSGGKLQLQFSLHTTDEEMRNRLMPVRKWDFEKISLFGERFYEKRDRKITLNFALAEGMTVKSGVLLRHFDPEKFLIKVTPINPTYQGIRHKLCSYIDPLCEGKDYQVVSELRSAGYEVLISIGEIEENQIGSNCGQYLIKHLKTKEQIKEGYTYKIQGYS
jgi:23S rRNA (adenine2503-C2)-methyltransferase